MFEAITKLFVFHHFVCKKLHIHQDAEKSLRFYRNVPSESKSVNKEFEHELFKLKTSHELMLQRAASNDKEKLSLCDLGNF